jgi:hypothetical protein
MTSSSYRTPKVIRLALNIFPTAFRARYGHELWQCIRDARRDLGNDTFAARIRFWILIVADLALSGVMEWLRSVPRESWPLGLRRTGGALLIAVALANVAYDAVSIKLSMGVFAALLTAVTAVAGTLLMRSGPGRPS